MVHSQLVVLFWFTFPMCFHLDLVCHRQH